ncbi:MULTISPECIES: LacI family DNA-binding transcriptional regulator [unclassified Rathayibacter]|uniref:LacI family DNA-binding transcriptional regulator n=1 Tax=unclassified Rathayibacter TaxID=2609250 RepID=UPI001FB253F6|nr:MULTISPECIES: LacI family DNA-binding transcriptional regulator [unclassified Rathayibacter]MCJ1674637.1 LacI family transcriptional regulator [Rathayibacter sp. VKM Ac-2929]MCJ1682746.1 LacI family transcriptional regulator [Rathayibacter sp. VKM Ac-2928]
MDASKAVPQPDDRGRRVSMADVARAAGVSQKTVSRVVNGEAHVSPEIGERVATAIRTLGFRPNAAARALVTQRSRRIGMVTMSTSLYGPSAILDGVEQASRAAGYSLSVVRTAQNSGAELQEAVDALVDQGVDGIILSEPVDLGHPRLTIPADVTVLSFDHPSEAHRPEELVVGTDEAGAARSATEHLLALGHETVWHIAGAGTWSATRRRIDGWRTALADANAAEPPVLSGDWSPRSGAEAMASILHRRDVTAVFAANDQMAVGAIHAAEAAGLRIPEDLSVVGFDDDPISEFLHRPLTTVKQDFAEVTRIAMHRMIRTLDGHAPTERHRSVPAQLIVRASSGPANPERAALAPASPVPVP